MREQALLKRITVNPKIFGDFLVMLDDGQDTANPLNLIVEVTGEKKKDKEAKVSTVRTLCTPAVNNHGEFGRWAFIEIDDPWDAQRIIRNTGEHVELA